ncbi:MAG: hypothetical protein MUF34_05640 [Polyangiaceae bacterium]|jgi:hypothetical protein|nr:hypothetical protein [Polyangiaceae bacterium]
MKRAARERGWGNPARQPMRDATFSVHGAPGLVHGATFSRRRAARAALGLALALGAPRDGRAQSADEGGVELRGRFEEGLAYFRANDLGKAIGVWSPIVEQMGDERAYRLLFNVGVAHEALGDATRAADHYERFLARVEARSARGQKVPADVLSFRDEARGRLAALQAKYGRVRVANDRGLLVAVRVGGASGSSGRTYYVVPGAHEIVLRAGAAEGEEKRRVEVRAGAIVDVAPSPPPSAPPRVLVLPAPAPPPRVPPYSPWVVVAAGGVTLASTLVPLVLRNAAVGVAERYYDPSTPVAERADVASDYDAAKARYAWSFALPGLLAAGTGALAVYYFVGEKPRPDRVGASTPLRLRLGGPGGALGLNVVGVFGG